MTASKSKPSFGGSAAVEIGGKAPAGGTRVRRSTVSPDKLITQPFEGIDTVTDVLNYAARTYGSKRAYGSRDIVKMVEEEKEVKKMVDGKETVQKKTWKYFQLSDFKYISFIEARDTVYDSARGLLELGVQRGEVCNVFAQTSANWQLFAHGAMAISGVIATAYETLGEAGLTHSLDEPECVGVFTNAELLPIFSRVLPNVPSIRFVVYDGEPQPALLDKVRGIREGVRVLSFSELVELGKKHGGDIADRAPKKEDTVCIMYTSGTTGNPKGVVLTHANLVAAVGGVYHLLGHHLNDDDTILHYLPLAHILEYIVELTFLFVGITAGFGRIKTLTDVSVRNCAGDLRAFAPSIIVGVPAVFETIRKGILQQVLKKGAVTRSVFNASVNIKKNNVPVLSSVVDAVVLKEVKARTGGRLRLTMSGGAALGKETQEFLTAALVTVLQGYGMTESCGMCAILPPEFFGYNKVGAPVPCIEIKLLDVPDAGYKSTNPLQQGEILIRGPSVTGGYYKRPDLNNDRSVFTEDGWLRTGDVGQWNADGTLSIIDRIKNLVKLNGGEYIALERLESTYKSCNLVSNICVLANADLKQPVAAVFPHEGHLRHALGDKAGSEDLHALCTRDDVKALVLKECNAAGKAAGLKSMEMLAAVVLTPEEWTPESGLVTAAQKIQRKKIEEAFSTEIKAAYEVAKGE